MPTDRDLIHQTLKGNLRAFDTLVQKYQPVIYAQARLLVQNPQDAEDLTQEVFIKAYQNLPKLRDASRFAGWLSQIVKNACMTWLHQQKETSKSCQRDVDPILSLSSAEATPEQFLMKKELNQTILEAIDSLPAVDGAVAHDFYIDHLSYDEISEKRELSHRAIPSRLHRAKQRIAEKVKYSLGACGIFWKHWGAPILRGMKIMSTVSRSWFISLTIHLMCAMESISLPSRPVHYSPGVYRFMTNVAIYALTHGKISDYSGYAPEDKQEQQRVPTHAPQAARIGAIE